MDQRSMTVLNQLVQQDSYISVQKLAAILNVSRRTIYNDLEKINNWLTEHHLPEIQQVRAQGLYIDEATKKEIVKNYAFSKAAHYAFSPLERRAWIYLHIVGQDESCFLDDMKELFQVSRNTVLDDIKKLKEELQEYQLRIFAERKIGYTIEGNENDIRRLLIYYLSLVIPEEGWYGRLSGLESSSTSPGQTLRPYQLFNAQTLKRLRQLLNDYERQYKIEFTDDVLNNLVVWFYFFIKRIMQGKIVEVDPIEKEVIKTTDEYKGAITLCNQAFRTFDIAPPNDEVFYVAKYLLSAKVNYNLGSQLESQEMKALLQVVEKMAADFQLYAAIEFREPEQMIQNLLLHLKPAYYRIKYGIQVENALQDLVKQNYPEVFHITKKVMHHFEDLLQQPIHENEVAFIAMHFGGWLRKEGVILEKSRKRLLIVCTNGLGTSRLLESQLEGLFSNIEISGVTSLRDYKGMDLDVDFIVSTILLPDRGVPVFVVNPVLNNEDKEQLLKKVNSLFEYSSEHQVYSVDTVMDMINRYASIEDDEALRQELRRYLHAPLKVESEARKPNLYELLPANRIVLKKQMENWQDAIKAAAEPLLKQGYILDNYITKMIRNVSKDGPYIVISELFALPHASPEDGVNKTGMSMLHLEEPVDILGKAASVIIVLASWDNEQHLKALSQLTKLFTDKARKQKMIETTDKRQIIKLLHAQA